MFSGPAADEAATLLKRADLPKSVLEQLDRVRTDFGRSIGFRREADGRIRCYVAELHSGEIVKSFTRQSFEDALIDAVVDIAPPSGEQRT